MFETCPLLEEIPWIKHGFFSADITHTMIGIEPYKEYPRTLFLKQTHSDKILTDINNDQEADASITNETGLALAIKTADCCPILLVCTDTKEIAVVHAGKLGAANRIASKTVEQLIHNGAKPENIIAAIGPCIHQETYVVQDDMRDLFVNDQLEALKHFIRFEDRWKMDVPGIVKQQLKNIGVGEMWQSPINTFTDPRFASYRKDKTTLRNVSLIVKI
jgi:YfiH family protein